MGIFTAAWVLVLLGTIIVFGFIIPLEVFHSFFDGILKGILATILVMIWLFLFVQMRNVMVKSQLRIEKKAS
jgi:TRAP-type C4-dicarboxylate transport system permease large subunit